MRKRMILPMLLLAAALLLCGCGGRAYYTVDEVEMLVDAGAFPGSDMVKAEDGILPALYGIDAETALQCVGYLAANTSDSADEVAVFIMKDKEAAAAAEEACRRRVEEQLAVYRTRCPEAVPRLEDAYIHRLENTVLLAVGDAALIAELLKD